MLTDLTDELEQAATDSDFIPLDRVQMVSFMVHDRSYGVDILSVREIRQPGHLTMLPNQPDHVRGVLNLRGAIVPVYDLGKKFSATAVEIADVTVIIIVQVDERVLGMLVDAVSDILTIDRSDIKPMPAGAEASVIAGLLETDAGTVTVLNLIEVFPNNINASAMDLD